MKRWKLDVIGFLVIGASCYIKKDLELIPIHPDCSKGFRKLLPLHISIRWPSLMG